MARFVAFAVGAAVATSTLAASTFAALATVAARGARSTTTAAKSACPQIPQFFVFLFLGKLYVLGFIFDFENGGFLACERVCVRDGI